MIGQQIIEAQLAANHFGQSAGGHPDMAAALAAAGIERRHIFPREATEILGVDQMAGQKATLIGEPLHGVRLEPPALVLR